jgi:hypothetical protein
MPYAIVKEGDKYVVRKKLLKGKMGKAFGSHPTRKAAEKQIAAIHASEGK